MEIFREFPFRIAPNARFKPRRSPEDEAIEHSRMIREMTEAVRKKLQAQQLGEDFKGL